MHMYTKKISDCTGGPAFFLQILEKTVPTGVFDITKEAKHAHWLPYTKQFPIQYSYLAQNIENISTALVRWFVQMQVESRGRAPQLTQLYKQYSLDPTLCGIAAVLSDMLAPYIHKNSDIFMYEVKQHKEALCQQLRGTTRVIENKNVLFWLKTIGLLKKKNPLAQIQQNLFCDLGVLAARGIPVLTTRYTQRSTSILRRYVRISPGLSVLASVEKQGVASGFVYTLVPSSGTTTKVRSLAEINSLPGLTVSEKNKLRQFMLSRPRRMVAYMQWLYDFASTQWLFSSPWLSRFVRRISPLWLAAKEMIHDESRCYVYIPSQAAQPVFSLQKLQVSNQQEIPGTHSKTQMLTLQLDSGKNIRILPNHILMESADMGSSILLPYTFKGKQYYFVFTLSGTQQQLQLQDLALRFQEILSHVEYTFAVTTKWGDGVGQDPGTVLQAEIQSWRFVQNALEHKVQKDERRLVYFADQLVGEKQGQGEIVAIAPEKKSTLQELARFLYKSAEEQEQFCKDVFKKEIEIAPIRFYDGHAGKYRSLRVVAEFSQSLQSIAISLFDHTQEIENSEFVAQEKQQLEEGLHQLSLVLQDLAGHNYMWANQFESVRSLFERIIKIKPELVYFSDIPLGELYTELQKLGLSIEMLRDLFGSALNKAVYTDVSELILHAYQYLKTHSDIVAQKIDLKLKLAPNLPLVIVPEHTIVFYILNSLLKFVIPSLAEAKKDREILIETCDIGGMTTMIIRTNGKGLSSKYLKAMRQGTYTDQTRDLSAIKTLIEKSGGSLRISNISRNKTDLVEATGVEITIVFGSHEQRSLIPKELLFILPDPLISLEALRKSFKVHHEYYTEAKEPVSLLMIDDELTSSLWRQQQIRMGSNIQAELLSSDACLESPEDLYAAVDEYMENKLPQDVVITLDYHLECFGSAFTNGLDLVPEIRRRHPWVKIIMLTNEDKNNLNAGDLEIIGKMHFQQELLVYLDRVFLHKEQKATVKPQLELASVAISVTAEERAIYESWAPLFLNTKMTGNLIHDIDNKFYNLLTYVPQFIEVGETDHAQAIIRDAAHNLLQGLEPYPQLHAVYVKYLCAICNIDSLEELAQFLEIKENREMVLVYGSACLQNPLRFLRDTLQGITAEVPQLSEDVPYLSGGIEKIVSQQDFNLIDHLALRYGKRIIQESVALNPARRDKYIYLFMSEVLHIITQQSRLVQKTDEHK